MRALAAGVACSGLGAQDRLHEKRALEQGRTLRWLSAGYSRPVSSDRDIDAFELGTGVAHYLRDGLALGFELDAVRFSGSLERPPAATLDADTLGVSGNVGLRWHFLRRDAWSTFLDYGVGVVGTLDEFPPGGTRLNFTRYWGGGITAPLGEHALLVAGLRQRHLSNGRGLVPDNPSWDGIGGYLGLALPFGHVHAAPSLAEEPWTPERQVRGSIETHVGRADGEDVAAVVGTVEVPIDHAWRIQIEGLQGELASEELQEIGLQAYRRDAWGTAAVGWLHRSFAGVFDTDQTTLQLELHADDLVTAVLATGYAARDPGADDWLGACLLRLYPLPDLMIESGIAVLETPRELRWDSVELPLSAEYQLPFARSLGISLFFEDRVEEPTLLGLRFQLGGGSRALRSRHREDGLRRVRF